MALEAGQTLVLHDKSLVEGQTSSVGPGAGILKLYFEASNHRLWQVVIFGAGHVTQSLVRLLTTLPCRITCIDPRPDWLAKLPVAPNIETIVTDAPPDYVASLSDDAFVICMTRGHKSDLRVLIEIFKQARTFPYLGVIGRKSKAEVLRRELTEAGIAGDQQVFHCPLGLSIGTVRVHYDRGKKELLRRLEQGASR